MDAVPGASLPSPWRGSVGADALAGLMVSLIALPLCLGIAMASGFPPIAGVLTAIVGGVVTIIFGGAPVAIKGPAAGLIVIALGAVVELGGGDAVLGYRRALAVGVVAALLQIALAWRRMASVGTAMPTAVVHGMLAAIGVIIVSKQAHTSLGVAAQAATPLESLVAIPGSVLQANPEIAAIAGVTLIVLVLLPRLAGSLPPALRWPPPIVAVVLAVGMGIAFDLEHGHYIRVLGGEFHVGPEYLLSLPGSLLTAVAFPDFSAVMQPAFVQYVLMFALVGSIESTLSVLAIDSFDPRRRSSDLDRDLLTVGIGNLIASAIGGLPMISEIVRSKANLDAGAVSTRANLVHGLALFSMVGLLPNVLHHVPLAALAAILVHTGMRLATPAEFVKMSQIGWDQLTLFVLTCCAVLVTDLLLGVLIGLGAKIVLHRFRGLPLTEIFGAEIQARREGDSLHLILPRGATFATVWRVRALLMQLPAEVRRVVIDTHATLLVDHTFLERVHQIAAERADLEIVWRGLEGLHAATTHAQATRLRKSTP